MISFRAVFRHAQEESSRHAAAHPEVDRKVIIVVITTCVMLTLQNYLFRGADFERVAGWLGSCGASSIAGWLNQQTYDSQDFQLAELLYWSLGRIVTYVVVPAWIVKYLLRERIRDYGLAFRGIIGSSWLYMAMFLIMLGPLALVSQTAAFQAKYPFYHLRPGEPFWPRLWIWEAAYIAQFFALEFFFRGFLLHGLRERFGFYSIFVMTVPYCMIHFGKPMAETCGAIGAGVALGFMSLKTRSIWLGACLHVAVALSMDFLSLWQKGML